MYPLRDLPVAPYLFVAGVGGVLLIWVSLGHPEPADPGLYLLEALVLAAFVAATASYLIVKKYQPHFRGRSDARESTTGLAVGAFICAWVLAAGGVNLINWHTAGPPETAVFQVVSKRQVMDAQRIERLPLSPLRVLLKGESGEGAMREIGLVPAAFEAVQPGDRVRLTLRPGRFFGRFLIQYENLDHRSK